jgi:hypothetical protein
MTTMAMTTDPALRRLAPDVHELARQALAYVVRDRREADDLMAAVLAEIGRVHLVSGDDLRAFGERLARREAALHRLGLLLVVKSAALGTLDP